MIHLYTGDGKGKTTCAMGLALRAAGRDKRVVIAQFLKDGKSGERLAFTRFPNVTLIPVPTRMKFVFAMDEVEKQAAAAQMQSVLEAARRRTNTCDMLVLDEVSAAIETNMVALQDVLTLLDGCPETVEVVMTGRNPPPELMGRAHYITEMKKKKHPYDTGMPAREGIEY